MERCRELFECTESSKLTEDPLFLNIDKNSITTARDYLEMVGVAGQISRLVSIYTNSPDPDDGTLDHLKLKSASEFRPPKVIEEIQTKFVKLTIIE